MNLSNVSLIILCWHLMFATVSAYAQSNTLTFENNKLDVSRANAEVVQHMDREALLIRSGTVLLESVEFQDGTIEVDIAPSSSFAFAGLIFRAESADNLEEVYFRLHKSGLPDAVQYTPRYNAISAWQLYNGEGYTAAATFSASEWIHLKIEVRGKNAEIYIGENKDPVLSSTLVRNVEPGKIGLWGLVSAYFSNFQYTAAESNAEVREPTGRVPANFLTDWEISQVFSAESVDLETYPTGDIMKSVQWSPLSSDTTGLVNISTLRHVNEAEGEGDVLVYARTTITSDDDQVKKLSFGYSDEISIFLNGRLLFRGNSRWRSRDIGFNGIVGLNDHLYLDLKEGENELLFAVTEWFGGWGYMAKLE